MSTFLIHLSMVMSKFCDFVFLIFILMYNGFIHKHNGKGYLKKSNFLIFCVFVYMGSTNNLLNKSKALVYGPHTKMNDFFIGNIPYQKSPYFGSGYDRLVLRQPERRNSLKFPCILASFIFINIKIYIILSHFLWCS